MDLGALTQPDPRIAQILQIVTDTATGVEALRLEGEAMTQSSAAAVAQLVTRLENIQGDVTGLKEVIASQGGEKDAIIAQLRTDLAAALEANDPAATQAAVDAALAQADEAFTELIRPASALAEAIDLQTPPVPDPGTDPGVPPVEPTDPTPPVEEPTEPPVVVTPDEPAPPVEPDVPVEPTPDVPPTTDPDEEPATPAEPDVPVLPNPDDGPKFDENGVPIVPGQNLPVEGAPQDGGSPRDPIPGE